MWAWFKKKARLWGVLGEIVAIFALGCAATIFIYDKVESTATGTVAPIDQRVTDVHARMDRIVAWVREQVTRITGQQDAAMKRIDEQYNAINMRLDAQNQLLLQIVKEKNRDTGPAFSAIPSANAAGN